MRRARVREEREIKDKVGKIYKIVFFFFISVESDIANTRIAPPAETEYARDIKN